MRSKLVALIPLALVGAAAGPGGDTNCGDRYVVVRHDTLYSIARRCHTSVARIASDNRIAYPAQIKVGQTLMLDCRGANGGKPDDRPGTARDAGFSYRMAPQDTLYSLARWSRVGVGALLAANPGINPRQIEIGDLIRLPRGAVDPQPMRTRERGPVVSGPARTAAPPPPPVASPRPAPPPHAAPLRPAPPAPPPQAATPRPAPPAPPPRAAPPRIVPPVPPPPAERHDDQAGKPDDGNLNGRNQPEGM